jgi:hypothetical protein
MSSRGQDRRSRAFGSGFHRLFIADSCGCHRGRAIIVSVNPLADSDRVLYRLRRPWPPTARVAAAFVAAAGLALPAAACGGGSSGSHVAKLGTTTAQSSASSDVSAGSAQSRAVAFARCMRSHAVPNWPDPEPGSGGRFDKSKLTPEQLGAGSSRIQAAENACRRLLPNGGSGPDLARVQELRAQALSFSRCVRSHGVANFPDPDRDGRIPDPATVGIDQGSPKFEAANQACGRYRPPYMPSNAAYNVWARTHGGS